MAECPGINPWYQKKNPDSCKQEMGEGERRASSVAVREASGAPRSAVLSSRVQVGELRGSPLASPWCCRRPAQQLAPSLCRVSEALG